MINKYYISPDNKRFDYLPGAYNGTTPLCDANCTRFGWQIMTEEVEDPVEEQIDETKFRLACEQFRGVCMQIRQFTGIDTFKGGFDEYSALIVSPTAQANPAQTALLAAMWNGANEYCKYEGSKIGYGQPDWWYKCWEYAEEEQ